MAELDRRREGVIEQLQRLTAERNLAPENDARALAGWLASGEKGRKPEPTAPALARQIEELERERDALLQAADDVLEAKAEFVAKHRRRLVRDADSHADELRERYEQLVTELAKTRDELAAARSKAVWAATFPSHAAGASPPMSLAGGRRAVLERAGIERQVNAGQLWDVLKADAEFLATALTDEQRQAMGLTKRSNEATWTGTPEGIEAERKEKAAARERYRQLWGREIA